MRTARRTALTATLATTAALTIAGVAWGIGTTVGGEGVTPTPISAASDTAARVDASETTDGAGRGLGRANGRRGSGQQSGATGMGGPRMGGPGNGGSGNGASGIGRGSGGGGPRGSGHHPDLPAAAPGATVSADVAEQLTYLVEEEKLAGDVYALAQSLYGARVFTTIARAEDAHADEVRVLLDRYDVTDPTVGAYPGEFTDSDLQALYDQLAERVRTSVADAVSAGILIEQTDIADLQALLEEADLPADVRAVAENLLAGSQRHLSAFQRQG